MAKKTIALNEEIFKLLDGDFLKELLSKALAEIMENDVNGICRAEHGERSDERANYRNGYRPRDFETRLGSIALAIPKIRKGSYLPSFIDPRRRWEKAFVNVVCEAYILGVSTRKIEDLIEALGAKGMSKSEVSRMATELDETVDAFRNRKLDKPYPYLWLDAIYQKVRDGGRVVSKAVLIAFGCSEEGDREVIGIDIAEGELEISWKTFLESLLERGLHGVRLVISDAHSGLKKAISCALNGCTWQRCSVHFLRNLLSKVPKSAYNIVLGVAKTIFKQPSKEEAKKAVTRAIELLRKKFPGAAEFLTEAEEDVLAFMDFPEKHWRKIHSTNPLERLNREIRRRTDVVGIFPNPKSALRLIGMLLVEQNDEWMVNRRYFSLESMELIKGLYCKELRAA